MKISYSCTQNIKTIINSYYKHILNPKISQEQWTWNYLNKGNCSLEQKCLAKKTVYKANNITSNNHDYQEKGYTAPAKLIFKKLSNHKKPFNLNKYKNETELSNEIWQKKRFETSRKS